MGCGCSKRQAVARQAMQQVRATQPLDPDPTGAIIAAARAGAEWRVTIKGGTIYSFPTLAQARDAQRAYGGTVSRV